MSTTTRTSPAGPISPRGGTPYRMTAEEYYRLIEAGVIASGSRVELWEGQLVEKMGKNQPHVVSLSKLIKSLVMVVPPGWYVSPETPVEIGAESVPEPDLTVIRGEPDDYPRRPPAAPDVALVVEVADTSLRKDTGRMLTAYARAGIPFYWVVNLPARRIEVYSDPTGPDATPTYRQRQEYGPGDDLTLILDGREIARIAARDILPRVEA